MVASILFYDHIEPIGAFAKESKINIKASVKLIQTNGSDSREAMINVLKFSTVHLNSESTPKNIKALLS